MARLINDGSTDAPKLCVYLNLDNLTGLRADTIWPGLDGAEREKRLAEDGFEGVQLTSEAAAASTVLPYCGLDRISTPVEARTVAARHADRGDLCVTVHAGWGIEDDLESARIIEAILEASDRYQIPIFVETHRATITQDIWRTVELAKRFPDLRFNGDYSHYYCGQEMVYGDWETKLAFMEPIFRATGFMHGRIASPGSIQVPIGLRVDQIPDGILDAANYVQHFKDLWVAAMTGFLRASSSGDVIIFTPELLSSQHYYARLIPGPNGSLVEESDRYEQALVYMKFARHCFREAQGRVSSAVASSSL